MSNLKAKKIVIKSLESILVVGYILFEELIWNVFAKPIYQYFKSLIILDSLKKTFLGMNRYLLLSVFIFILGIAEVMGFLSGFFIINGYLFSGVFVYVLKIPVAAFTFWLFKLTKDQLMTFHWLKTTYLYIMDLIDKLINSDIHVYIKARIATLRAKMKQLSLYYFGKQGFVASVKTHYLIYKSYIANIFKIQTSFRTSKNEKPLPSQTKLD
jgi:hypothetical protein